MKPLHTLLALTLALLLLVGSMGAASAQPKSDQGADDSVTFTVTDDEHGKVLQQAKPIKADKDAKPRQEGAKASEPSGTANGRDKNAPVTAAATPPTRQWTKWFGGSGFDSASSVKQTRDGGYVLAGVTASGGVNKMYLVKTTSTGAQQWTRSYGVSGDNAGRDIEQTKDGGYIVAGYYADPALGQQFWLQKLNATGQLNAAQGGWSKTYGGSGEERAYSVNQTTDGGYVAVGYTTSLKNHGAEVYLLKVDAKGNVQWQKTYGGLKDDYATCVKQAKDGGYVICGETKSWSTDGRSQGYLIKTDSRGDIMNAGTWETIYEGTLWNTGTTFTKLVAASDGYYIVGTSREADGHSDLALMMFSTSGSNVWHVSPGLGPGVGQSIATTSDGNFITVGVGEISSTDHRVFVVKSDKNGMNIWRQHYGNAGTINEGFSIAQTKDGGYAVAGTSTAYGNGYQATLWKLYPEGGSIL